MPSSKWIASTAVSSLTLLLILITSAQDQGIELPQWVALVGAVLGPVIMYLKPERRPSRSAAEALGD